MNWGTKITISLILFAAFVFTLVYKMLTSGNDLVKTQYYRSGTQINQELKQRDSSSAVSRGFQILLSEPENKEITLQFDSNLANPSGMVELICLSADNADQKEVFSPKAFGADWQQTIKLKNYKSGNWICEVKGKNGSSNLLITKDFRIY
jgi:hypothetical protein